MQKIDLSGSWNIRSACGTYNLEGEVPGTFFKSLEDSGFWKDKSVFWRDNNQACRDIADRVFIYSRVIDVPKSFLESARAVVLDAEGLDTLAVIHINGKEAGRTENMHRRYLIAVGDFLREGENLIEIEFLNTLKYIEEKQKKRDIWSIGETSIYGFNRIRKCSSSFGWDWGPIIPDLGIWKDISLKAVEKALLSDPEIRQIHTGEEGAEHVTLKLKESCRCIQDGQGLRIRWTLTAPDGMSKSVVSEAGEEAEITVDHAQLWWPNGYGEQPLYDLSFELLDGERVLDSGTRSLGLRTIEIDQDKDEWGERFGIRVNGITIFAMGGNVIPQDVYNTRPDRAVTEKLLKSCADANFNCIRVWGGGIYPDHDFMDICDRLGLLVWQDLMFACALYEAGNPEFRNEISAEVRDNLARICHHASLAMICGNNEMEWAFTDWPEMVWDGENKAEYTLQYDYLLPEIAAEVCPHIPYWKASPSSGGYFDNPNDPDRGDVHYWDVWHNGAPFTDFRKHHFRFLSEYGFQSFPSYKTVCSYTEEGDRNPFSPIMEDHQRNGNRSGNQQVMKYAAEYFRLGRDLDAHCYISQLSQAEAGRYAVEHLRQNRGRCLGSTYWQVNDNWPTASWSSVDYYGRWKALHYAMKRAYAPVLLSCREEGDRADLYLSTEGQEGFRGELYWELKTFDGKILKSGKSFLDVPERTAFCAQRLNLKAKLEEAGRRKCYLSASVEDEKGRVVLRDTTTFVRYKQMDLPDPSLSFELLDDKNDWIVRLRAEAFAKFVELDLKEGDTVFEDNYFDMDAGEERLIRFPKKDCPDLKSDGILLRSLYNSYN